MRSVKDELQSAVVTVLGTVEDPNKLRRLLKLRGYLEITDDQPDAEKTYTVEKMTTETAFYINGLPTELAACLVSLAQSNLTFDVVDWFAP